MIVNQLRKWRLQAAFSQLKLSVEARVSPAMVVAVERYGYQPGADVRAKIAKALGIPEAEIWPSLEVLDGGR